MIRGLGFSLFAGLVAPAVGLAGAVLLLGSRPGAGQGAAAWLGIDYLLGCTLLAIACLSGTRWLAAECAGMVASAAVALWLAGVCGAPEGQGRPAALVLLFSWFIPWCWVMPLRRLGLKGGALAAFLGLIALTSGTPFLVPPGEQLVPLWVMEWNPLVRLLAGVLDEDWFHGPLLYGRISGYFSYPRWDQEAAVPLMSGFASLALAEALRRLAKRGPSASSERCGESCTQAE